MSKKPDLMMPAWMIIDWNLEIPVGFTPCPVSDHFIKISEPVPEPQK